MRHRHRHRRRNPAAAAALETSEAAASNGAAAAVAGGGRRAPAAPAVLAVAGALAVLAALAVVPQPASCIHLDPPKVPHVMNFIPYPFEWKHRGPNGTLRHPGSVACTLIRNEAQFFEEWAAFHLMVGFDLIVVYDDSSTDELEAIAESFGDMVYLFRWPPPDLKLTDLEAHIQLGRQVAAFQHCYDHFKTTTNFVGIFDVDEFVYPCQRGTQPLSSNLLQAELHRGFMDPTYPSVQLDCLRFGAPWGERWDNPPKPEELTLERHTFRAPYVLFEKRIHDLLYTALEDCNKTIDGYSLCNTQGSGSNKQLYHTELYRGDAVVGVHNGNLWRISGTYDRHGGICCNHYQQRSWKGMMAKAEKNRNPHLKAQAESWMVREFYASVRDDLVLQYLPELRCLLRALRGEPGCSLQQD